MLQQGPLAFVEVGANGRGWQPIRREQGDKAVPDMLGIAWLMVSAVAVHLLRIGYKIRG